MAKVGESVGSVVGGAAGTALGGPVGGIVGSTLGSVAGGLVSAAPSIIKSDYEKYNKKRLEDLQRKQELGLLGLTEEEKSILYNQQAGALKKAAEDVRSLQSGLAGALATGAGSASAVRALQEERLAAQRAEIERSVQEEDYKRKMQQEQELENRLAQQAGIKQERVAALSGVAMTGIGALDEELARIQGIRGVAPSGKELESVASGLGISTNQLAEVLGRFARDPAQAKLFGQIVGNEQVVGKGE